MTKLFMAPSTIVAPAVLWLIINNGATPLDTQYAKGPFRLFYSLEGPNALPVENQEDRDGDGTPDFIQNVALRLNASFDILTDSFGQKNPLQSGRYAGKANIIAVDFLTMDGSGSASDSVSYDARYEGQGALTMKLSTLLRDGTLTPTHELFHLFQNGYTMFKNRWYTEGTARWSEGVLKEGTGSRQPLPDSVEALAHVLTLTYDTKYMWRQLAYLLDTNNGVFSLPEGLPASAPGYGAVPEDNTTHGYAVVLKLLEELDRVSAIAAIDYDVPLYDWSESLQKSDQNNPYILCAIKFTVESFSVPAESRAEVDAFMTAIEEITTGFCTRLRVE